MSDDAKAAPAPERAAVTYSYDGPTMKEAVAALNEKKD